MRFPLRLKVSLRRLRKSIAVRFLTVSILAVAATVPVRLSELRTVRLQSEEAGNATVARIANVGIERLTNIIDESKAILTITALLPTFGVAGVPDCHQILTPVVAETEWINSISAVDAKGHTTCSSTSTAEGLDIADREHLREALARGQFQLSGPVLSRGTKQPAFFAAIPVTTPGSGTAALVMAINASWFTTVARDVARAAPGGVAMIVDRDGRVIERSKDGAANDTSISSDAIVSRLAGFDREDARPVTMQDGNDLVIAVRDIPHSKSSLVIGVPPAALNRHAAAIEGNILEDLVIAIGVIILVFWLGHESFVRPVLQLAAAARQLGRGRFDITIDSSRWAGEFQILAAAITSASAKLASRAQADAKLKATLRAQSEEDPLTGLKNRRGLDRYVELEWHICRRKNQSFAAIAFDVDFFKPFNDCYGHDTGDKALRAVARIISDQAQQANGIAARTGGEEFTIVAAAKTALDAKAIADAVSLRVTALRIPHAGSPLGALTISAGIAAAAVSDELTSADVFRTADAALYGAKEAGRNTITIGTLVTAAPHLAPTAGDTAEPPSESSRDIAGRMPQVLPSARSR